MLHSKNSLNTVNQLYPSVKKKKKNLKKKKKKNLKKKRSDVCADLMGRGRNQTSVKGDAY